MYRVKITHLKVWSDVQAINHFTLAVKADTQWVYIDDTDVCLVHVHLISRSFT